MLSFTEKYGAVCGVIQCYPRYYAECRITSHTVMRSFTDEYGSVCGGIRCYPCRYVECRITSPIETVEMQGG